MKRSLLFLFGLLFAAIAAEAQPMFVHQATPAVTSDHGAPFNATTAGNKVQWIYPQVSPLYFVGAPTGYITAIYVTSRAATMNATYTNFQVKMGQSTGSATFSGTTFETTLTPTSMTPVLGVSGPIASYVIPTTPSHGWVKIALEKPFFYDNTKNLIIEVSHAGSINGFPIRCDQVANTRIIGVTPNATGTARDGLMADMGIDIKYPCDSVRNLQLVSLKDSSAEFTWTTFGQQDSLYEYIMNTDPNPPTLPPGGGNYQPLLPITTNNLVFNNLQPDSCYYLHISKKCKVTSVTDTSMYWQTRKFCTLPACETPKVTITDVLAHTAYASWDPVPGVYEYEWAISTSPIPPTKGTRTTYTKVFLQGLTNTTFYYFHLRAYCSPTPTSAWGTSPLTTLVSSVDDVDGDGFGLAAYPNPVNNVVTIKLEGIRSGAANAVLLDVTGKVLRSISISKDETSVDMSGLAPGMYIIKYQDEARSRVMKINKQ